MPTKNIVSSFNLNANTPKNNNVAVTGQQHHLQLIHLGLATPLKTVLKGQTNILD